MLHIFEVSFHARMSFTLQNIKTLRITSKVDTCCSTRSVFIILIPYFQINSESVIVAKISLHYISRIDHLRLRLDCPYSHKGKPNVLKIIGTAKFSSIIVSLMDHWINYTMVLYVVTKSWFFHNQYFVNSWHKKGLCKERRVQGNIEYILN